MMSLSKLCFESFVTPTRAHHTVRDSYRFRTIRSGSGPTTPYAIAPRLAPAFLHISRYMHSICYSRSSMDIFGEASSAGLRTSRWPQSDVQEHDICISQAQRECKTGSLKLGRVER